MSAASSPASPSTHAATTRYIIATHAPAISNCGTQNGSPAATAGARISAVPGLYLAA
jgi:hypothetical protein